MLRVAVRTGWGSTRQVAVATFAHPPIPPRRNLPRTAMGCASSPPVYQYVCGAGRVGADSGDRGNYSTAPHVSADDIFLSPSFVQMLAAELLTLCSDLLCDVLRRRWASWWTDMVTRLSTHSAPRRAVRSWRGAASCTAEVRGLLIVFVFRLAGAYASMC